MAFFTFCTAVLKWVASGASLATHENSLAKHFGLFSFICSPWLDSCRQLNNGHWAPQSVTEQDTPLASIRRLDSFCTSSKPRRRYYVLHPPALISLFFHASDLYWRVLQSQITKKHTEQTPVPLIRCVSVHRTGAWRTSKDHFLSADDLSLGHMKELIHLNRSVFICNMLHLTQQSRRKRSYFLRCLWWRLSGTFAPKNVCTTQRRIKPSWDMRDKVEMINIMWR